MSKIVGKANTTDSLWSSRSNSISGSGSFSERPAERASATDRLSIAVIIPTRDEAIGLPRTLTSLRQQTTLPDHVLVVDGGSSDRTVEAARNLGADVIQTQIKGRGNQIALGVARCTDDVIVIAHGDMHFPRDSLERILLHLRTHPDCPGGCLGHRFDSRRWIYRLIEWCNDKRAAAGDSYGDQAQFFRREWLAQVGGFPAQPILEDVELTARLQRLGPLYCIRVPVTVSPRRFERLGVFRALWQNWRFRQAYRRGGLQATQAIFERYYSLQKEGR